MPCNDAVLEERNRRRFVQRCINTEAMLCALARTLNAYSFDEFPADNENMNTLEAVLAAVDWQQTGVTREFFDKWWRGHQRQDRRRRRRALQKLTKARWRRALKLLDPTKERR